MHFAECTESRCNVFQALLQAAKSFLIQPSCPIFLASLEDKHLPMTDAAHQSCGLSIEEYGLGKSNTSENEPLPLKALGTYLGSDNSC